MMYVKTSSTLAVPYHSAEHIQYQLFILTALRASTANKTHLIDYGAEA